MGYSHYWYWGNRVPKSKMAAVAADLQILRPRLEREMGVRLAGNQGKGEAEITDQRIRFNGPEKCGRQTFLFDPREGMKFDNCQGLFNSCSTGRHPYDLAVTACLLAAKYHFGARIRIETDGETKDWADAARIIAEELGYGMAVEVRKCRVLYEAAKPVLEVAA